MHLVRADLGTDAPASPDRTTDEGDPDDDPLPVAAAPARPRPPAEDTRPVSDPARSGSRRGPRWLAARVLPLLVFLLLAAVVGALHALAATRPGEPVATLGETRLAVGTFVERGLDLALNPLPLGDRLAALQLAVVQLLLPLDGASIVDATRWACLALGAVTALLAWPVLRGLGVSASATAVGVALLGAALPAVTLHAGISAGAPAAVWLMFAAWFAVRQWGRAAMIAAVIAALTAPLAAVALLALGAHLVLGRMVRVPGRLRVSVGLLLGLGAAAVAALAVSPGPLAGTAGPAIGTGGAAAGVAAGLLVVGLAWGSAGWMRPLLTAAVSLLLVALAPGPSRTTAILLVAPMLVVAGGLLLDQLGERMPGPAAAGLGVAALLVVVVPTPVVLADRPPVPAGSDALIGWLVSEPRPGTVVHGDELDRAELLVAGFPAGQLRAAQDPSAPGALRLVTDRPTDGPPGPVSVGCPGRTAVAGIARGTGGAPGAVCRTDGAAESVAAESARRTRLGSALADNPSLQLSPAAAAALRAGEVDPRLILVLTGMSTAHRVAVDDFPTVELDSPALPRRQALLTLLDGNAPASSELLRNWLTAQQPPFVPSAIRPVGSALLVGYPAPPLSGLLPE